MKGKKKKPMPMPEMKPPMPPAGKKSDKKKPMPKIKNFGGY